MMQSSELDFCDAGDVLELVPLMRGSGSAWIAIVTAVVSLALPTLCFVWSPSTSLGTNSGCHGHHGPMPQPTHSCCYAADQVPAVPVAPALIGTTCVVHRIIIPNLVAHRDGVASRIAADNPSPPLPAVLRI